MLSKLIVALDVEGTAPALELVEQLADVVDIFKVGLQLFTAAGPRIVEQIQQKGSKVFLDLKLHDIPNTVAKAVAAAQSHGVYALTVHTCGGQEMLQKAAAVNPRPQLWGVTVLTSLDDENLKNIGFRLPVKELVPNLAKTAKNCGLDGIVCSPREIALVRPLVGDEFTIVAPGVRAKTVADDQKRTLTAGEAVKAGADYLVVGRPVLEAKDPREAALAILKEIGEE